MRLSSDVWGSGPREYGIDEGRRDFSVTTGDSLGSLEHLSSCGCGGCLEKIQIDRGDAVTPQGELTRTDGGGLEFDESAGVDSVGATTGTASTLAIGATTNGFIHTAGDEDWYAVTMVAGQSYSFSLVSGSLADAYLEIYNSSGALIGFDDDFGSGYNSTIRWTATQTGTYYIAAQGYPDEGLTGSYSLTAATAAPASPLDAIDYHFTMPTTSISIWFATAGYTNLAGDTAVRNWTQQEIDGVMAALATYSAITPLTFSVAASQGAATWIFSLADLPGNTLGYFAVGDNFSAFDPNVPDFTAGLTPGGNSWVTIIHEAGHGLGMAHPHDNGAEDYGNDNSEIMQGVTGPFDSLGTFNLNQGVFTTMTYNDGWRSSGFGGPPSNLAGGQATPMALDVALMQQRYGVNNTTGAGNTAYTLALASSAYRCIWDVSGTDGISYAGSGNATIDLRAATLLNAVGGGGYVSFVQGVHGGFTIANGVVIENATTGSGSDTLIGNDAANTLDGGSGVDNMSGGLGDDTYMVDNTNDVVTEGASGGTDTVISSATYTLLGNVENLTLTGGSERHGTGNTLDNVLIGNGAVNGLQGLGGNDRLVGNGGNDMLLGGTGVDTAGYAVASSAATWTRNPNGTWTVTGEGTDTLTSVEFLDFTDRDVFLDRAYSTFSGDGTSDILMRHSTGAVGVWFVDGSGVNGAAGLGGIDSSWAIEGVADFSGDGRDDIFMRNTNGNLGVWFMNGASATGAAGLGNIDLSWDITGLGDLNGDGFDDIVMWNANGSLGVWFMNNGAVSGAAGLGNLSQATWDFEALADFNGDGKDDILWRNTSGDVGIWFMDGGAATGAGIGNIPTGWAIEGAGDFNGDGRDDILMRDGSGNLGVWFMNGASATGAGLGVVSTDFSVAAIGDYNGDGRDDILWWHTNGSLSAWFMNGASGATATGYGAVSNDWVINPGG